MELIAHRGLSARYLENTLEAFDQAFRAGARWIELDTSLAKDGIPIVIHDDTVDRTTNARGLVSGYTSQELQALGVPTLAQVLALANNYQGNINVELKSSSIQLDNQDAEVAIRAVARALVPQSDRLIFSSFHPLSLGRLSSWGEVTAYLALEPLSAEIIRARVPGCQAIHLPKDIITPQLVQGYHQQGFQVRVFTVNDPDRARQLKVAGVDAIFVDDVAAMMEALCG